MNLNHLIPFRASFQQYNFFFCRELESLFTMLMSVSLLQLADKIRQTELIQQQIATSNSSSEVCHSLYPLNKKSNPREFYNYVMQINKRKCEKENEKYHYLKPMYLFLFHVCVSSQSQCVICFLTQPQLTPQPLFGPTPSSSSSSVHVSSQLPAYSSTRYCTILQGC